MDYFFLFEKMSAFTSSPFLTFFPLLLSSFPSENRMKEFKKKKKDWERIRNNVDNVQEKMAVLLVVLLEKFMAGV